MNKKSILVLGALLTFILTINFVSAGLCKGYDGYYHDCDDDKWFYDNNYDDEYYRYGKYYPTRDYYYRDYYEPRYRTRRYDRETHYEDVEEYSRTIEYTYEDRYRNEKIRTVISQITEIELDYDEPYYDYRYQDRDRNYGRDYDRYYDRYGYENDNVVYSVPWHYSEYQKLYL